MMAKLTEMREKLISKKKDNKGFTLVELIVVIVILAILVGVTIGGVYGYVAKSRVNTDINNAAAIQSTLQILTTCKDAVSSDKNKADGSATLDISSSSKTYTDVATALNITSAGGKNKIKELLPNGIDKSKLGGKLIIKYTTDKNGYITSLTVQATEVDGTTILQSDEDSTPAAPAGGGE